jgi:hypothetical protein
MADANGLSHWLYWQDEKEEEHLLNFTNGVSYKRDSQSITINSRHGNPETFQAGRPGYHLLSLKFESVLVEALKEPLAQPSSPPRKPKASIRGR